MARLVLLVLLFVSSGWSQAWQTVRSYRGTGAPAATMCNTGADLGIIYTDRSFGGATYVCRYSAIGAFTWYNLGAGGGGGMIYPGAGVANSTGAAWGTSYTVGSAANNLVRLDALGRLPAVSAALLTSFPTFNQNTTGTAGGLSAAYINWNAVAGGTSILNKPTLGAMAAGAWPGAGVPNSTGAAWGTSYTVGTGANNLVQLNGSSQLPAVSAALLTNFPTFNQNTTGKADTAGNADTVTNGMTQAVENSADNSVSVGVGTTGRAFEKTPFTIDPANGNASTPGTLSSGSAGTVAGELELYELGANGSNFRSWLVPDAITADLQLKHADGLPAGSVMTFPTPTGTVSQYSWTNYTEAATASTIPIRDSGGHINVAAEAYDATNWDGDTGAPQKDAVRDKIETLAPSGVVADAALAAKYKQCVVSVTFTGSEIANGKTSLGYVPANCSLTDWTVIADATLTAAIDIERVTRASWTGTLSGTSIIGAGTNPPAISAAVAAQHADITNDSWTSLALLSDDTVEVILSGVTVGSATKLVLVMRGTK